MQETHVNFSHLHNIRELWDGEAIISPGKTQTCGILVLAKRTARPVDQIRTEPARRSVFFKVKNTTDALLAFYVPSATMKEPRIDRQMFIRKIKKMFHKKTIRKTNLILLGDFNMTLDNKDRSTGNKGFCKSQEEIMSLIMEFDLEDIWRRQNSNGSSYTHFHGRGNTYSRIDRAYTSTKLRVVVEIDHEINLAKLAKRF